MEVSYKLGHQEHARGDDKKVCTLGEIVNMNGIGGRMKAMKEYLGSFYSVKKALLAYIMTKKVVLHPFAIAMYENLTMR